MAESHELVNRVLNDADFRHALMSDPEGTLRANGVEPTAEMLNALKGVDEDSLSQLARDFGDGKLAASC
jgi:hypothetical protein